MQQTPVSKEATRSTTVAEAPRDALCQFKSQQLHICRPMKKHILKALQHVNKHIADSTLVYATFPKYRRSESSKQ